MGPPLPSIDIPQADRPASIRALVQAVDVGFRNGPDLERESQLSERHVAYYLQAARILGLVELHPELKILPLGKRLLNTMPGSPEEQQAFRDAILASRELREAAGDFLRDGSSRSAIAQRLESHSDLSRATAERRARSFVAWREYATEQLTNPASLAASVHLVEPQTAPREPIRRGELIPEHFLRLIQNQMRSGKLVLMTGAGFSTSAKDASGKKLPVGPVLGRELWPIAFPNSAYEEDSSLGDIFAVAVSKNKPAVAKLLISRLTVDPIKVPEFYRTWYSLPWRKIYTLNIDTLALAVATRYDLPRKLLTISASPRSEYRPDLCGRDEVRVIHLNGCLADGLDLITFSAPQYGKRHSDQDSVYAELATDLLAYTFVFVGTALDESPLWHHIELREARLSRAAREFRPRSFIVTPHLSLPRQGLLEQYKITWIPAAAQTFAEYLVANLTNEPSEGLNRLRRERDIGTDSPSNIRAVSELIANPVKTRTEYLLGEHPQWSDLVRNRAVVRESDDALGRVVQKALAAREANQPAPVIIVNGTGGAGKSTTLMRLAMRMSAAGDIVGWVGTDTEVSPKTIGNVAEDGGFAVIGIDDVERYGPSAPGLLRRISHAPKIKAVLATLRASKVHIALDDPALADVAIETFAIPDLTDLDIDLLLDTLDREHRLGKLKGLDRETQRGKFRERAGRQILVAMIETTSGERFDEKVYREWNELPSQHRGIYAMIAIAGSLGIPVAKPELLLASGGANQLENVEALATLADRRIVISDSESGLYRPRHRVIAETLIDELHKAGQDVARQIENLAFGVSSGVTPDMPYGVRPRRLLRIILNNEYVFSHADIDAARRIYEAVEENLNWDHHFWLQRGTLELQEGSIKFAEQCLNQAKSLGPDDPLVDTTLAHMLFRKAISNPSAAFASDWIKSAVETLTSQIEARGTRDRYPYHVLGSQAIAWAGKCFWTKEKKRALLDQTHRQLKRAVATFPRSQDLAKLERDVLKALLSLEVR